MWAASGPALDSREAVDDDEEEPRRLGVLPGGRYVVVGAGAAEIFFRTAGEGEEEEEALAVEAALAEHASVAGASARRARLRRIRAAEAAGARPDAGRARDRAAAVQLGPGVPPPDEALDANGVERGAARGCARFRRARVPADGAYGELLRWCAACGGAAEAHALTLRGGGGGGTPSYTRGLPRGQVDLSAAARPWLPLPDEIPGLADEQGSVWAADDACQACGGRLVHPSISVSSVTRPSEARHFCSVQCALRGGATPLSMI